MVRSKTLFVTEKTDVYNLGLGVFLLVLLTARPAHTAYDEHEFDCTAAWVEGKSVEEKVDSKLLEEGTEMAGEEERFRFYLDLQAFPSLALM